MMSGYGQMAPQMLGYGQMRTMLLQTPQGYSHAVHAGPDGSDAGCGNGEHARHANEARNGHGYAGYEREHASDERHESRYIKPQHRQGMGSEMR